MKIDGVGLFVADIVKSVEFYKTFLNVKAFTAGGHLDWNGGSYAEFFKDGYRLMLYSRKDFEEMVSLKLDYTTPINGTMEIMFDYPEFTDVDKEFNRIIQIGATPVLRPTDTPWGQRTSYVADPDGNLIEISSFGKKD